MSTGIFWGLTAGFFTWVAGFSLAACAAAAAAVVAILTYMSTPYYFAPPRIEHSAVVVTGASSGIGKHAAEHLAGLGFTVFAGVRKEGDKAALSKAGCHPIILDVTKEDQVAAAALVVGKVLEAKGVKLVGIVNNAGVMGSSLPIELETEDNLQYVFGARNGASKCLLNSNTAGILVQ